MNSCSHCSVFAGLWMELRVQLVLQMEEKSRTCRHAHFILAASPNYTSEGSEDYSLLVHWAIHNEKHHDRAPLLIFGARRTM